MPAGASRLLPELRLGRLLTPRGERVVAILLLACFTALCAHGLLRDSPTVDEFAHLPDGVYIWRTGDFSLFPLNPPLVKLVAALPLLPQAPDLDIAPPVRHTGWYPWVFGTDFMERNGARYERLFEWGRLPVVGLGVLLGLVIWRWARRLYGPAGGLLALFLYAFCPAFIAHAHLATVDVGLALFVLLTLAAFQRFVRRPAAGAAVVCGVVLGLALLTKFTALLLYPLFLVLAVVELARGRRFAIGAGTGRGRSWRGVAWSLVALALVFAASLLVLNAGYFFQGVGRHAGDFRFASSSLRELFAVLPPGVPVPLPAAYLMGLDALQRINEVGEYPTYLFGRTFYGRAPAYFPLAILLKTPLPLLAAWLIAPFARRRDGGRGERFVWLPALGLLAVFCLASRVHYGIRYVLPVLALGIVYAGRLAPHLRGNAAALVLALYPLSSLRATPDTIDYFNVLAAGRGDAFLLDSNLDWGQGLERLAAWMDEEGVEHVGLAYFGHVDPGVYGISWEFPRPGPEAPEWTAVSANFLHGLPYATYYDGRILPVPAGAFTWLAAYPERRYLGGGLFLVHTVTSPTAGASTATSPGARGSAPRRPPGSGG
jgi:hypothetical protein